VQHGYGSVMTVDEVVKEILKDEVFYFHSGGGVTISGGEPLAQCEFTADILRRSKEHGVHTAIETTLFASAGNIERVLPVVDHLFVDLKHVDDKWHTSLTGATNASILANLRHIGESGYPGKITVRIPLVPTLNDDDENLLQTALICKEVKQVQLLELLPYHRLGMSTYEKLGMAYKLSHIVPPTREYVAQRVAFLRANVPELPVGVAR
jgi:pyruvate formate lyase activating enzyme